MARISTTKPHFSGVALGGIGAGSVELLPDGEFHYWQIANPARWARVCGDEHADDGERHAGALSFWVRAQEEGRAPIVRKLGMRTENEDFTYRMFAWNKPVERIDFDGRFPVCDLNYVDAALACKVSLRATAPFVPHDAQSSATPGFYMDFTLENPTDRPLTVSLLGVMDSRLANGGSCANALVRDGGAAVVMRPETPTDAPDCGSLCLSAGGDGEISWITADYRRYLREYVAHSEFGVSQESVLFRFRETGDLPDTDAGARPEALPEDASALSEAELDRLCGQYSGYPFVQSILGRLRRLNPGFPADRAEKEALLRCCAENVKRMGPEFGACALCSRVTLQPGQRARARFILAWHFPNHFNPDGARLGHYYETLFDDALAANRRLASHPEIADRAAAFADLLYRTSLPEQYPDAWSIHLSTLVKSSWWLRDGRFGLWEGLGFCGFHTTDITYHAAFGLTALFPELQLKQMEMGARFQRGDGRVHHFFTPDLDHVDDGFDRVDMNPQFVLMVWRDYLYTGDGGYLARLWEPVRRAMDASQQLDGDGDGLPDTGTRRNTYDAWNFSGTPAYIDLLWLAALKAAAAMADRMGDSARAAAWRETLSRGLVSLEEKLWNGRYYDLWRDENQTDGSLMSDQLDGEWFLRMAGLEGNLPDGRVREVLKAVFAGNFDPEDGLVNATCPADRPTTLFTYLNCQAEAVWTGIGYAFAALALSVGLQDIADTLLATMHENQRRLGLVWDHWECGPRYTRPLSSWTTLIAAAGLSVDRAARTMTLRPAQPDLTVPLCLCDVLGTVSFSGSSCSITCAEGSLDGWTIRLPQSYDRLVVDGRVREIG